MCGIIGSVDFDLGPESLNRIAHRGPNDRGWEQFSIAGHTIRLGHTRLAIQDVSPNGHQPMIGESGVLIYNGEIYNHLELRARLGAGRFSGHGDTETLLRLLERDGPGAFAQLNGIFAFAYLDLAKERLYLVRDAFGVKPLYYSVRDGGIAFCSELRGLVEVVGNSIDLHNLALALRYRSSYAPCTIYDGVCKLSPGTYLQIDLRNLMLAPQVCSFAPVLQDDSRLDVSSAIAKYRTKFEAAVRNQLLSDVEVGLLLSGGVDSALVASVMARLLPYRTKAFTVGFGEQSITEIDEAGITAARLGLDHHTITIGEDDFLAMIAESARIVEEPTATTSIVPMYALSRLAADHVRVVLSGQGADECNGGYTRYRAERFVNRMTSQVGALAVSCGIADPESRAGRLLAYVAEQNEFARYLQSHEVFSETQTKRLLGIDRLERSITPPRIAMRDPANRMMAYDLALNLPDDLLLYTDKLTMHFALECRVPFLDVDLVQFLMSLPGRRKVDAMRGKKLHRQLARTALPHELVGRKKKGFLVPTNRWFRESRKHWDMLLAGGGRFSTIFDTAEVKRILRAHEQGRNLEKQIMMLLTSQALCDAQAST